MIEVVFSHWGLATSALIHGVLTVLSGALLTASRYGLPPHGRWLAVTRVAHVALGLLMFGYLVAAYVVTPY